MEPKVFVSGRVTRHALERLLKGNPQNPSIVIHGPQACGKTTHAVALAKKYGLAVVLDGWREGHDLPEEGVLALTDSPPRPVKVLAFAEAMEGIQAK